MYKQRILSFLYHIIGNFHFWAFYKMMKTHSKMWCKVTDSLRGLQYKIGMAARNCQK